MSRPEVIICNKCGKEIATWRATECSAKIQLWGVGEHRYGNFQRIDLCEECYEKFVAFLESGSEE